MKEKKNDDERFSLKVYSIILSVLSLLTTGGTIMITYQVSQNENNINAISILTISQMIIWDSYCCISHLSFALHNTSFIYHFLIPSVLHMLNFGIVDLRLVYKYWQIKRQLLSAESLQRQKIRFYLLFYLFFFISILSINKFFYQKIFIFFLAFFLWIPQIIDNLRFNNNISLPLIYVLIVTLDRLFVSFYFKSYSNNCFGSSPEMGFMSLIALMVFTVILLMYSQMIFGPRWFFPYKLSMNQYDYYKTEEEIYKIKGDIKEDECVICLCSLFNTKTNQNEQLVSSNLTEDTIQSKTITKKDNMFNNLQIYQDNKTCLSNSIEDVIIEPLEKNTIKKNSTKTRIFLKVIHFIFNFNWKSKNELNKEYMITPCDHVFHSYCLELWLARKKECPHCRKQLENN